ncbi:hypothetical protein [Luteimonas sp. gir]|uniref:hypothetical protein n=1 Tax=Luteimonas sp. gir TaxID=3127960 RepID=UPI003075CF1B
MKTRTLWAGALMCLVAGLTVASVQASSVATEERTAPEAVASVSPSLAAPVRLLPDLGSDPEMSCMQIRDRQSCLLNIACRWRNERCVDE